MATAKKAKAAPKQAAKKTTKAAPVKQEVPAVALDSAIREDYDTIKAGYEAFRAKQTEGNFPPWEELGQNDRLLLLEAGEDALVAAEPSDFQKAVREVVASR